LKLADYDENSTSYEQEAQEIYFEKQESKKIAAQKGSISKEKV